MKHLLLTIMSLFLFSLLMVGLASARSIEFEEELSLTIDGISKIDDYDFNDINGDGSPEILVRSGELLLLYSVIEDSILYESILPEANYREILLDDINRDSAIDIAVGYAYAIWESSDTAFAIDFFDGSDDFAISRSYFENAKVSSGEYTKITYHQIQGITVFDAIDIDSDGYKEFFFSTRNKITVVTVWITERTTNIHSRSRIYHSFPDSLACLNYNRMEDLREIEYSSGTWLAWNAYNSYQDWGFGRLDLNEEKTTILLSDAFCDSSFEIRGDAPTCEIYNDVLTRNNHLELQCMGDIDTVNPGIECVATHSICQRGEPWPCPDTSGAELILYSINDPNSVKKIWSKEVDSDYYGNSLLDGFIYIPGHPGYFFAFDNDRFVQFNGEDGTEFQSTTNIPVGTKSWVYPFDDYRPYLITLNSNVVSIYKPVITTDVDGGEELP